MIFEKWTPVMTMQEQNPEVQSICVQVVSISGNENKRVTVDGNPLVIFFQEMLLVIRTWN